MDWYFGRDNDDLVVPKDQEPSDSSLSSDYWLQWGVTTSENFGSRKYCARATKSTVEELNVYGQGLNYEVEESSVHEGEGSCGLHTCGEFPLVDYGGGNLEAFLHRSGLLGDQPDYQLDGLGGMDQMDDIFLSSLLEEDPPEMENPYRSIGTLHESKCRTMPFNNLLTDTIMDFKSTSRDPSRIGNSKYLETRGFPQSTVWEKLEDTSHFILSDSGQKKCSLATTAPMLTVLIPTELNTFHKEDGCVDKETSLEAMVLQELEVVMTQLTQKTRICFRDALYRLAKSSRRDHLLSQSQNGETTTDEPSLSTVHHETSRFRRMKPMESETNTIDRTVAKLMFNNPNCDQPDLSVNLSEGAVTTHGSCNYSLKQSPILPSHPPLLPGDAEVPILGREN